MASARADITPVHSMTRSAPRPAVASKTCSTTEPARDSMVTSAPSSRASSFLNALRLMPITLPAPRALAICTCNWPDTPRPMTATDSPKKNGARRCACKQVVATWMSGAVRLSTESGRRKTWPEGTTAYSAKPPFDSRPIKSAVGTQIGLADAAVEAGAAEKNRIDDDAVARADAVSAFAAHHFADHFVAHDQRVFRRNRAFVDFQVGAADAAVGDAHQDLAGAHFGRRNIFQRHVARRIEDHRSHHCYSRAARQPFAQAGSGLPLVS